MRISVRYCSVMSAICSRVKRAHPLRAPCCLLVAYFMQNNLGCPLVAGCSAALSHNFQK